MLPAMRALLFLCLAIPHWVAAQLAPPTLRLPEGVRPLRYTAELEIRPDQPEFRGALEIEIALRQEKPVVWLNARFTVSSFVSGS